MKKIILLFCILLLTGCKSKQAKPLAANLKMNELRIDDLTILKVNLEEVDNTQKAKAHDLGSRVLMACNTSNFKPFDESEATSSVIKNASRDRLTKTCLKFRLRYGDFKELELVAVYKNYINQTTLFRYRALYEKEIANKEFHVTLNSENKVSSIKSMDWSESFETDYLPKAILNSDEL